MKIQARLAMVAVLAAVGLPAAAAAPHDGRGRNVTTRGKLIDSCSDIEVTFDRWETARDEETRTVPRASVSTLTVPSTRNGGVQVVGWDRDEYSVTACKAAGGRSYADAERLVKQIRLDVSGGRVTTSGPSDDDDWLVYLLVRTPRNGSLDLEAHNGPIGLREVSGRVRARTYNGPLSFTECNGEIDAEVHNGPISIRGSGGNFRLRAQNGPLTVKLAGTRWNGDLDATTRNGPVTVVVPEGYQSGVRVESSGHSPVSCRSSHCAKALRTWEHPNRISIGTGEPVVRISTVNGPVRVE